MMETSLISVLVAAIASLLFGYLWYSPYMFGGLWIKLVKKYLKDTEKNAGNMTYTMLQFVLTSAITAWMLDLILTKLGVLTVIDGVIVALWISVCFVGTSKYTDVLFLKKRKKLFLIDAMYYFFSYAIMAAIIMIMK